MSIPPQEGRPNKAGLNLTKEQRGYLEVIVNNVIYHGFPVFAERLSTHGFSERGARVLDQMHKSLLSPWALPISFQEGLVVGVLAGEILAPKVGHRALGKSVQSLFTEGLGEDTFDVAAFMRETALSSRAEGALGRDGQLAEFADQIAITIGGEAGHSAARSGVGVGISIFLEAAERTQG